MRWFLVAALFLGTSGCRDQLPPKKAVCAANPPLEALTSQDRFAVQQALARHRKGICSSDECEFRIRKLDGGNTLVRLRAVRYAEPLKQCITVFQAQTGEIYDPSGKPVDSWPYCYLMAKELEHDPTFEPDPSFGMTCEGSRVRSNNSFKPKPLRSGKNMAEQRAMFSPPLRVSA